jgi:hypothetical protein
MRTTTPLTRLALTVFLLGSAAIGFAQGPPGRDPYNPPPGHGGVPPGQAKKGGYDHVPPGQAKKEGYDHVPPGQAKKYRDDYHFRSDDRGRLYGYYREDADRWRGRRRPAFVTGRAFPSGYVFRPVPESYWVGAPPPPGYQYGYYGGYVVAYNPTTRIVADVMDLVGVSVTIR